MIEELKPCPFCGGEANSISGKGVFSARVGCDSPDCKIQPEALFQRQQEAIAAWNTRAATELKPCPEMIEKVAEAIEDVLFGAFGAGPYEKAAKAAVAAITTYDPDKRLRKALEALEAIEKTTFIGVSTASEETRRVALESAHDIANAALSHNGG